MNKKLIILLIVVLCVIFTFLVSQFGSNSYSTNPVQATYLRFESEELTLKEVTGDESEKLYYYLPDLNFAEKKEIIVDLQKFVKLDPEATNQKSSLRFSIVYDDESQKDYLSLVEKGALAGRLTITGQTSATITVSTTDGSGLSAQLYIRPAKKKIDEHHNIEFN